MLLVGAIVPSLPLFILTSVYISLCQETLEYVYPYICIYIYVYPYICIYIYVYPYICICIYELLECR